LAATESQRLARPARRPTTGFRTDDLTEAASRHEAFADHTIVLRWRDAGSGLNALVAVHDQAPGPAVAYCRMAGNLTVTQAIDDVLTRSRVMTRRAALAGLKLGGGALTIVGSPRTGRSPALFRALGRLVDRLGGGLMLLQDMGIGVHDLDFAAMETPFVLGATPGGSGDASVATAYGAYLAASAALRHRLGGDSMAGATVAVQGAGRVGYALCTLLARENVSLLVADADGECAGRVARDFGAAIVVPAAIYRVRADVLVACAGARTIDDRVAGEVAAGIVVAAAEAPLSAPEVAATLAARGILYVPECVAGAGGLLNAVGELDKQGYDRNRAMARFATIGAAVERILAHASTQGTTPVDAAEQLAASGIAERRTRLRLAAVTPAWSHR
jgi:leucine dehydrogenase